MPRAVRPAAQSPEPSAARLSPDRLAPLLAESGGAVVGGLSDNVQPRFRTYVVEQKRPSYAYGSEVIVGAELPEAGLTYYEVPAEYNVPQYRYTVVNNRTVLVDPRTRRIVQVVN